MPIYDFKCESCGHVEEDYFMELHDTRTVTCPECKAGMTRLPGRPQLRFSGHGWCIRARGGGPDLPLDDGLGSMKRGS